LRIPDQALAACVEMAARFLPMQCFPGKAIRMLDGVCASASLAGKDSVEEVKSNVGRIIVFIDEIHTLLGMGATEGSTGAENILKPSLARGEFPCIGATTSEEYRQYIEPDRALARRFQTITIPEPDVRQSLEILKGIKSVYEKHYRLRIPDQALAACVEMAARFLPMQCFPGKAIRMLDGVCASASLAGKDSVEEESVAEEFNRL
jgi:ATP-dependent Clp protease ATP-binding subunit ClpC